MNNTVDKAHSLIFKTLEAMGGVFKHKGILTKDTVELPDGSVWDQPINEYGHPWYAGDVGDPDYALWERRL